MSEQVTILVGTMTGTAELVAEDMCPIFEDKGFDVEIVDMDGLDEAVFERPGYFVICTSTYGQGDVPDNAMDFYEKLCGEKPDLSAVRYGVVGLGDSTYSDTYNQGGARFDKIIYELGGQRIGERVQHNASSDDLPEQVGIAWAQEWVKLLDD